MKNDIIKIVKEFQITLLFYSCAGVLITSNKTSKNEIIYECSVPSDTNLILNGKSAPYGDELAKQFEEVIDYYYNKIKEKMGEDNKNIKIKYCIRNETYTGNGFKYTLNRTINTKKLDNIDMEKFKETINKSVEYIGENGVNINLNRIIEESM